MSIRRYLFLLLSAVILLLSASQLFLAWFFKGQLQQEVEADSRAFSRELVSVVFDSVSGVAEIPSPEMFVADDSALMMQELEMLGEQYGELSEALTLVRKLPEQGVHIELRSAPDAESLAAQKATILAAQKEIEAALAEARTSQTERIREQEQKMIEQQQAWAQQLQRQTAERYRQKADEILASLDDIELSAGRVEFIAAPGLGHELDFRTEHSQNLLNRYVEWMLLLIVVTALLAIVLASWVVTWVSRPMSELAEGHRQLGEGHLGVQVKEQGIRELKRMLSGFNRMSLKLAELSKKEQQMAGQQHLAELGQVTRGIAHSLRNPLQTLGMLSDSVAASQSELQTRSLVERIHSKIAMMDKQIQSLLTLSANGLSRHDALPLKAIIQDILLELSITGCKLQSQIELEAGLSINGAESEVRSILHAVLVNACEASSAAVDDNSPPIRLEIMGQSLPAQIDIDRGLPGESGVQITVTDWGCGLSEAQKQHLGEPHFTTKAEGTGMGLYIARRLLQTHYGGEIRFEDNPEGGTKVVLIFRKEGS